MILQIYVELKDPRAFKVFLLPDSAFEPDAGLGHSKLPQSVEGEVGRGKRDRAIEVANCAVFLVVTLLPRDV